MCPHRAALTWLPRHVHAIPSLLPHRGGFSNGENKATEGKLRQQATRGHLALLRSQLLFEGLSEAPGKQAPWICSIPRPHPFRVAWRDMSEGSAHCGNTKPWLLQPHARQAAATTPARAGVRSKGWAGAGQTPRGAGPSRWVSLLYFLPSLPALRQEELFPPSRSVSFSRLRSRAPLPFHHSSFPRFPLFPLNPPPRPQPAPPGLEPPARRALTCQTRPAGRAGSGRGWSGRKLGPSLLILSPARPGGGGEG